MHKKASLVWGLVLILVALITACSGNINPTVLPKTVGDIRIRAEGNLILVTAEMLAEDLAVQLAEVNGVSRVNSYLEMATEPNAIIGVSPGSPLLVRGEPVSLASGEAFAAGTENVAIPGARVNANSYGFGMAGSAMAHRFQVGQTFELQGQRLLIIGLYQAGQDELETSILMPLSTAQRLFDLEGVISEAVVSVDSPERVDTVHRAIIQLLEERQ